MKQLSNWYRKVRVCEETRFGYKVQVRYIWWPFWLTIYYGLESVEAAKKVANAIYNGQVGDLL